MNTWTHRVDALCVVDPMTDALLLLGGICSSEDYSLNEVWTSHDNATTWSLTIAPWMPRAGLSGAAVYNSVLQRTLIYIVGGTINQTLSGTQGQASNDVWVSSDFGTSWSQLWSAAPFDVRSHARLTATSDGILILTEGVDEGIPGSYYSYYPHDIWVSSQTQQTQNATISSRSIHSTYIASTH